MGHSTDKRFWFGLILVVVGAFLLLDNLYILPFYIPYYFFSWKMILIVIGLFLLLVKEKKEGGLVLLIIGGVFLAPDIFNVSLRRLFEYWPVILIVAGIGILLRRSRGWHNKKPDEGNVDYIDEMNILGAQKLVITSKGFKGGKVTSILGGSEIDLTKAELGEKVVAIDSFSMFGGFKIIVPQDWTLKFEVFSLFGGFTDDRKKSSVEVVPNPDKVLVLKGTAIFGGGEVKTY